MSLLPEVCTRAGLDGLGGPPVRKASRMCGPTWNPPNPPDLPCTPVPTGLSGPLQSERPMTCGAPAPEPELPGPGIPLGEGSPLRHSDALRARPPPDTLALPADHGFCPVGPPVDLPSTPEAWRELQLLPRSGPGLPPPVQTAYAALAAGRPPAPVCDPCPVPRPRVTTTLPRPRDGLPLGPPPICQTNRCPVQAAPSLLPPPRM